MRPGSLSLQHKDRKEKTGSYYQLSYTRNMRSKTEYVSVKNVSEIRKQITNYKKFKKLGIEEVLPDPDYQEHLFTLIREVKKGNTTTLLLDEYRKVCQNLLHKGAKTAIVGCTELSTLGGELPIHTIDAAQILAMEIVRRVKSPELQQDVVPETTINIPS